MAAEGGRRRNKKDPRTSDIASFWKKKQKIVEADLKKLVKVIDGWKEMQNGG